jgi:outer membrane lipoprotein-sorting protein
MRVGVSLALLAVGNWTMYATARADDSSWKKGAELLRQAAARYNAVRTMTAEFTEEWTAAGKATVRRGRAMLSKPNLARLDYTEPNELRVWDGNRIFALDRDKNRYWRHNRVTAGAEVLDDENPIALFFGPTGLTHNPVAEYRGTERIDGADYEVVEASLSQGRERLYIGADLLIHRITGIHNGRAFTNSLNHLVADAPTGPSDFVFEPPAGARRLESRYTVRLLPVGSQAPDFLLTALDGRRLRLRDLLRKHKAVVVDYFAYA